jgi:hypothetical protein
VYGHAGGSPVVEPSVELDVGSPVVPVVGSVVVVVVGLVVVGLVVVGLVVLSVVVSGSPVVDDVPGVVCVVELLPDSVISPPPLLQANSAAQETRNNEMWKEVGEAMAAPYHVGARAGEPRAVT